MSPFDLIEEAYGRLPQPPEVRRPIRIDDVRPGMRVMALAPGGGRWGPAVVLPEGRQEGYGGFMVNLIGLNDAGDLIDMSAPAGFLLYELLPLPRLDLSCSCGEESCQGHWPVLERDPHQRPRPKPAAGGFLFSDMLPSSILPAAVVSCGGCDDCRPAQGDSEEECSSGPPADPQSSHGGYL